MTVNVDKASLLLILPSKRRILPLNELALGRAQATKRELIEGYQDAYLLGRDGLVRRIEEVRLIQPFGDTAIRRLVSRLTAAWSVSVELKSVDWSLETIKGVIAECVTTNGGVRGDDDEGLVTNEQLAHMISICTSVEEVFDVLNMPPRDEALDVL